MKEFKDINLSRDGDVALYIQISEEIKKMIYIGKLDIGYKLPPIRKLADFLGFNPSTIVKAYELLENQGYVEKIMGSGSFICAKVGKEEQKQTPLGQGDFDEGLFNMGQLEIKQDWIDLASTSSSSILFPVKEFQQAINHVLDRDGGEVFGYQQSKGYLSLRNTICEYLKNYGIASDPNYIQIISGAQQGIDILAKSLLNPKDRVIVENPTYTGAIASFKSRGAEIVGIDNTPQGIDLDQLEKSIKSKKPRIVYTMPNFHNPTGYSYSVDTKKAILHMAEKYNFLIIEDDFASELYFKGAYLPTLKSLDHNNRVIYIKSFSKVFAPGLRLALILYPKGLEEKIITAKHSSDISTSGLIQRAFDFYLKSNKWLEHIATIKKVYSQRCLLLTNYIDNNMKGLVDYRMPDGGIVLYIKLLKGQSGNRLYAQAKKRGVIILPGSTFDTEGRDIPWIRLSFTQQDDQKLIKAIETVKDIIISDAAVTLDKDKYYLNPLV